MAKKKASKPEAKSALDASLDEYERITGSPAKRAVLTDQYTENEIILFVHEIKSQKEAMDTENPQDISQIEQLARIVVQLNRLLKFQKDLLNEADGFSQLSAEAGPEMMQEANKRKSQAIKISDEMKELHVIRRDILKQLSVTREQRLKISNESKITLSAIILQLKDHYSRNKVGMYGEIQKKSTTKKLKNMIDDGLIIVSQPKVATEAATQEQSVGQQETTFQESQVQSETETPDNS